MRHDRAWIARILFVLLLVLMVSNYVNTAIASCVVAFLMVALGCLSSGDARRSVEWQVLVTIAAAFGVGSALKHRGGNSHCRRSRPIHAVLGALAGLAVIYFLGTVMTSVITNNAAAVLLFPFCLEAARLYSIDPRAFLVALMLSASACFMTPIGYQTNMMVYGPGVIASATSSSSAPLTLLLWCIAVVLIPIFWPLTTL
ncbi:MAG: SLC13 family permease [Planctomycetaceae bacterium]